VIREHGGEIHGVKILILNSGEDFLARALVNASVARGRDPFQLAARALGSTRYCRPLLLLACPEDAQAKTCERAVIVVPRIMQAAATASPPRRPTA